MANLLVLGDIHGALAALRAICDLVASLDSMLRPDAILATGDFVSVFHLPVSHANTAARQLMTEIERELSGLGCEVLCVAGNHDRPDLWGVNGCLRSVDAYAGATECSVHGFRVIGLGGSWQLGMFPYEWEDGAVLTERVRQLIPQCDVVPEVFLTHAPPAGAGVGSLHSGGEVGSQTIQELIVERQPVLSVCGHVHEAAGWGLLGKTWVLNAGVICGMTRLADPTPGNRGPSNLVNSQANFYLIQLVSPGDSFLALEGHLLKGRWLLRWLRAEAGHINVTNHP